MSRASPAIPYGSNAFLLRMDSDGSDPQRVAWAVHMPTLWDADRGIPKGGALPSTSGVRGPARPVRRRGRNCKAANSKRKRCCASQTTVLDR